MSTRKKKIATEFQVSFDIALWVSIPIVAETLEEAIAKGRTLQAHDVVDLDGTEYIDGSIRLRGAYE